MGRNGNESGVSVIVGTLLLILITVVAAAGLALMVSQMQKDEMNRQAHLAAFKNEKIEILNVVFEHNQTAWQTDGGSVSDSQNWSSVKITLVNLNTEDVKITGIAVNDRYALNYTDTALTGTSTGTGRQIYNFTHPLTIPGTRSRDVCIDFIANASIDPAGLISYQQPQAFSTGTTQSIKVITTLTNVFEAMYKPPTPVMKIQTETEDLGVMQRDLLLLDGSESAADTTVVAWYWNIRDASATTPPGNCADTGNLGPDFTRNGKVVRYNPVSPGPLCINLTVKDNVGMNATTAYAVVPHNPRFLPASALTLSWTGGDHILNATVSDTSGSPVSGRPVDYLITKNFDAEPFTLEFWYGSTGITNEKGTVTYRVCGNGTIKVFSEKLAEKYYSFVENGC